MQQHGLCYGCSCGVCSGTYCVSLPSSDTSRTALFWCNKCQCLSLSVGCLLWACGARQRGILCDLSS